jgi:hypothetical protein
MAQPLALALALQQPQPTRKSATPQVGPKHPTEPYNDENIRKSIDKITAELGVIREQQAKTQKETAERQAQPGPPIYSNWALAILAGIAAAFTAKTFRQTRRQADAAELHVIAATTPRLTIEQVYAADLEAGKEPVFFLRITNTGPVPAENVKVVMQVTHGNAKTTHTGEGDTILIPAHSYRDYDFRGAYIATEEMIRTLSGDNLIVRGLVTYNDKPVHYCYKYNQWTGPRPPGVPTFVPCDSDSRRTVSVALTGVWAQSISGTPTVVVKQD